METSTRSKELISCSCMWRKKEGHDVEQDEIIA